MTTWIKLHDNFWENPKVIAAGEDAALLYVQGLSYCSRNLTDGAILTGALRYLTAKKDARTLARILVREGLWIETATGWLVHDYLKVQRSREQVEEEREKARARKARSRSSHAVTPPEPSGTVTPTVRVPETDTETDSPSVPPEVWTEYARIRAEGKVIGNRTSWTLTVINDAQHMYGDRAAFLCQQYQAAPRQIAAALISGDCRSLEPYKRKALDA